MNILGICIQEVPHDICRISCATWEMGEGTSRRDGNRQARAMIIGLDQGSYWSQAREADDGVEWQMALVVSGGKCSLLPTSLVVLFFWDAWLANQIELFQGLAGLEPTENMTEITLRWILKRLNKYSRGGADWLSKITQKQILVPQFEALTDFMMEMEHLSHFHIVHHVK